MRTSVDHGQGDIRVEDVADSKVQAPTDAVVRITQARICGSDLWFDRGQEPTWRAGFRAGHEWRGVVEEVGAEVRAVKKGDRVINPFASSDGSCESCHDGLFTSCTHGGFRGGANEGGQAEAVHAPFADGTLVVLPPQVEGDDRLLKAILPLTDVVGTGHRAAVSAGVEEGSTVAVVGDGAVGRCGVLAAKRLGAARIILMGRHENRIAIARRFGATDVVSERGEEGVAKVQELTGGGAEYVLECVGLKDSFDSAIGAARPGGRVGYVGVPHVAEMIDLRRMFRQNISLRGGVAPVRASIPELFKDVIAGRIDPSPVLDMTVNLDGVPDDYAAMDGRRATKVMVLA